MLFPEERLQPTQLTSPLRTVEKELREYVSDETSTVLVVRVVTSDSQPIAGARVRLSQGSWDLIRFRVDDAGTMRFESLRPGYYSVALDPVEQSPSLIVSSKNGAMVNLVAGQQVEVGLTMIRAAAIQGTASDPGGAPLAGATIQLLDEVTYETEASVTADELGAYRFDRVRPARYRLLVDARSPGRIVPEPLLIECKEGELLWQDLTLLTSETLVTGRFIDQAGRPFVGLRVIAQVPDSKHIWARASTDEEGRFELGPLPAGASVIRADPREALPDPQLGFRWLREPTHPVFADIDDQPVGLGDLLGLRAAYCEVFVHVTGDPSHCVVKAEFADEEVALQRMPTKSPLEQTFVLRTMECASPIRIQVRSPGREPVEKTIVAHAWRSEKLLVHFD